MRKLLKRKIVEQDKRCAICHEEFTDYGDVVPDHEDPKGWEGRGGTTTPTTSGLRIGGATLKRDRPKSTIDWPHTTVIDAVTRLGGVERAGSRAFFSLPGRERP